MTNNTRVVYKERFCQADADGNYVDLGKSYVISVDGENLGIDKQRIPLLRVLEAKRVGNGASIVFLDNRKIPNKIILTTSSFFGIAVGRGRKLDELVDTLLAAIDVKQSRAHSSEVAAEREMAPSDACHDCGAEGGVLLNFGQIYSALLVARWSSSSGIYCRKHSTVRGVRSALLSGFLGWWSPWGIFITPTYLWRNLHALWTHSSLPKLVVMLVAVIALMPVAFVVIIYML